MKKVSDLELWVGTAHAARDLRTILEREIQVVVDLALEERPVQPTRELVYLRFPMLDGGDNPRWLVRLILQTVEELTRSRISCLLACSAGMSRSPAVAALVAARMKGSDAQSELLSLNPIDVSPRLWQELRSVARELGW